MNNDCDLYMRRCMELAQRAKGYTAPNPMVGAVLVYNDRIISEGWHHKYSKAHAEVDCLNNVAEADKHLIPESTMYVNLEPCAHYGKTPPCATRIVAERIKKVVIANVDPFEKVSGNGIKILRDAGVEVVTGIMTKEGLWFNRRFFCFHRQQRPYIILKWAQTQNGYFAPLSKERFQISNIHSSTLVHKWRTEEDAVLVGYYTALNDNPQLTARLWQGRQPLRLVTDKNLDLPFSHNLFNTRAHTWVLNETKQHNEDNIAYQQVIFDDTMPSQLLQKLHQANILSVIVEGGAALLSRFIKNNLWDEARVFTGNALLSEGLPAPLLNNANKAFTSAIEDDVLNVYVNRQSEYQYSDNMEL